jgi:hypothetical protein
MSISEDFKCYEIKCPVCKEELIIPDVAYEHTRRYGSNWHNFRCNKCKNVIKARFKIKVVVILDTIQKSNNDPDWGDTT